jgi:proteasome accessory factor B
VSPTAPRTPKIQRWIDLLAALLVHRYPMSFEELIAAVPAYEATAKKDARRRMFERDKDELRAFGVPIETRLNEADEVVGYAVDRRRFYLPYLTLQLPGRTVTPRKVAREGYRDLAALAFDADELGAVADAAALVRQVGDPTLAESAESAMRKLALDMPVDAVRAESDPRVVRPRREPAPDVFDRLADALERRKRVAFDYHTMGRDEARRRDVEPWGLFFLGQHWYLAARDVDAEGLRNFRLSRMQDVEVNAKRSQSADFEIPADFRLREHARSREAWALGDGGELSAVVALRRDTGAAQAAARLGAPVEGHPDRRRFEVRRMDVFVRWLLSFAGDLRPVEPAELVEAYDKVARQALALYDGHRGHHG